MLEKKEPTSSVRSLRKSSNSFEQSQSTEAQWQPGIVNRLPKIGLVALITILACAGGAVAVLLCSDGKTEQAWSHRAALKPSVLLSALNAISNLALSLAIADAVAIAWWRQALKGATVQELHESWSFSSSVKSILLSGKAFNLIALAALAAKISIADGILLQRATSTFSGLQSQNEQATVNITGAILDTLPAGYSGYFADNTARVGSLSHDLGSILRLWSTNPGSIDDQSFSTSAGGPGDAGLLSANCVGSCISNVIGAGFSVTCSSNETAIDYGTDASNYLDSHIFTPDYPIFSVDFSYEMSTLDKNYTHILMNVLYINTTGSADGSQCPGTLKQRTCELRPAKVNYPIVVTGQYQTEADYKNPLSRSAQGAAGLGASPGVLMIANENDMLTQWGAATAPDWDNAEHQLTTDGFSVVELIDAQEQQLADTQVNTTWGGIQLAMSNLFSTDANITMNERTGWTVSQTGSTSQIWIPSQSASALFCNYTISDPTSYIIRQLNQIMLTASIYAASQTALSDDYVNSIWNLPRKQQMKHLATQQSTVIFFATNRAFMFAALASTLICVLCVAPAYYGYWQLGRAVTLGPVEIANAFRAPILDHPVASNGELPVLLKEVGDRKVQYGVMTLPAGRLAIADTNVVEVPHRGTFNGSHGSACG